MGRFSDLNPGASDGDELSNSHFNSSKGGSNPPPERATAKDLQEIRSELLKIQSESVLTGFREKLQQSIRQFYALREPVFNSRPGEVHQHGVEVGKATLQICRELRSFADSVTTSLGQINKLSILQSVRTEGPTLASQTTPFLQEIAADAERLSISCYRFGSQMLNDFDMGVRLHQAKLLRVRTDYLGIESDFRSVERKLLSSSPAIDDSTGGPKQFGLIDFNKF